MGSQQDKAMRDHECRILALQLLPWRPLALAGGFLTAVSCREHAGCLATSPPVHASHWMLIPSLRVFLWPFSVKFDRCTVTAFCIVVTSSTSRSGRCTYYVYLQHYGDREVHVHVTYMYFSSLSTVSPSYRALPG